MCGICAVISKTNITKPQFEQFKELLVYTQVRGTDATGYAYNDGTNLTVYKGPSKASEFVKDMKHFGGNILMGHTRAKTKGSENNNDNNHPILYNNFMLVHNGCCSNDDEVFKKFGMKRNAQVDSEVIVALIDYFHQKGSSIEDSIEKAFEELSGGFACLLMHAHYPNKLWMWRTSNPISVTETESGLMIASTDSILEHTLKVEEKQVITTKSAIVRDLYIYTIENGEIKTQKIANKIPFKPSVYRGYSQSWENHEYNNWNQDWRNKVHSTHREHDEYGRHGGYFGYFPDVENIEDGEDNCQKIDSQRNLFDKTLIALGYKYYNGRFSA